MNPTPLEESPSDLLHRTQLLVRHACERRLRDTGVSMAQYSVLHALADRPAASAAELARLCSVTRQSLRDVLPGLCEAGWVTVAEHPRSGRARPVRITRAGRRRLARAQRIVAEVEEQMLYDFSNGDRQRMARLLARCAGNLEPGDHVGA